MAGAQAGKNSLENNALSGKDAQEKNSIELALSDTGLALHPRTPEEVAVLEERHNQPTQLDAKVDKYVQDACSQGRASPACQDASGLAQRLQDRNSDYLGRLTYKELNSEDYTKVSQIVANTTADKWDYAIEGYAKSQDISYQEAKDRFALAVNINQAADIAGILYGLKGSGGGSGSLSTPAASSLKQILSKYNEFKQNIASSKKGSNDSLALAETGNINLSVSGHELPPNVNLSTGSGGKVNNAGKGSSIPVPEAMRAANGLNYQSNGKHTPGQQGYSPKSGTEPQDSITLFGKSVEAGKKRYAIDSSGNVHQFTNTNDGTWHWSGSTGDKTVPIKKSDILNSIKK